MISTVQQFKVIPLWKTHPEYSTANDPAILLNKPEVSLWDSRKYPSMDIVL